MFVTRRKFDEFELQFIKAQKDLWDIIGKMNDGRKGDLDLMRMLHDQINMVKKMLDIEAQRSDSLHKVGIT